MPSRYMATRIMPFSKSGPRKGRAMQKESIFTSL
jgi:hypothetical protein